MTALLDVNLLLALFWKSHTHHNIALDWFSAHREQGWATCGLTQMGFVRISLRGDEEKSPETFADALRTLELNLSDKGHEFWPLDYPLSELLPEIRERIRGPQQITDAVLLDLAIRRKGKLATFDKRIVHLLPADSPHRRRIEILGAD